MSGYLEKSLPINQAYLILSEITGDILLSPERQCDLFYVRYEAEQFAQKQSSALVKDAEYYDPRELYRSCYQTGALSIRFHKYGRIEEKPLSGRVGQGFFNSHLNAAVHLFAQTKDSQYLEEMAKYYFIVPIRIKPDQDQEIIYATIKVQDDYRYLAFTDIKEFNCWKEKVKGWQPLMVNLEIMCQICKQHGYMINAMGNHFSLPSKIMQKIRKQSAVKDPFLSIT